MVVAEKDFYEISQIEWEKYTLFQETHYLKMIEWKEEKIPYCFCGTGDKTILTFAGGWGGPELLYNTIIRFENIYRILVVDVSLFYNPDDLSSGINQILSIEKIEKVILFGQSFSGIMAQIYLKENMRKIDGIILTNTIALHKTNSKKWAIYLIRIFPFSLLKSMLKSKLEKFGEYDKPIPEEALERIKFSRALIIQYITKQITKKMLINIFKNIFASMDWYKLPKKEFKSWEGRTLIFSSEDESNYQDAQILLKDLPNTELFLMPVGYKHISPIVHIEKFHSQIQKYIETLK